MHSPKEVHVEAMFDGIAPRYDLLNRLLSLRIDMLWRRRVVREAMLQNPSVVLDVATGTADLAIMLAKKRTDIQVVGVDISEKMLEIGRKKVEKSRLIQRITLEKASALGLPFPNQHFDVTTVAFGVRNFENPAKGLAEMLRTLKPGGRLLVLEFVNPKGHFFGKIYTFYFTRLLPAIGKRVSGHGAAYTYLPNSVKSFAERNEFLRLLHEVGFEEAKCKQLTMGVAALYSAYRPK